MPSPATSRSSCIPTAVAWLFVTSGLKDGPLPAHYEPLETPFGNPLYPERVYNPAVDRKERPDNPYAQPGRRAFPVRAVDLSPDRASHRRRHVASRCRILPSCSRRLFCEVSPELAAEVGLEHGDWATITTPRAIIEARVLVTQRMRPLWVEGRTVHQVGLPYHWGYNGVVTGDSRQ